MEGLPPEGFIGFIGEGAVARGIHRIHRWKGRRQREAQDSYVEHVSRERDPNAQFPPETGLDTRRLRTSDVKEEG